MRTGYYILKQARSKGPDSGTTFGAGSVVALTGILCDLSSPKFIV